MSHVLLRKHRGAAGTLLVALALLTASCASPPLSLYTLEPSDLPSQAAPLARRSIVIEIRRVSVPDYLDTQDILVRDGSTLQRSAHGRWATRLSLGVTRYLTGLLAARHLGALVTDQAQIETPDARISVTISTLDITSAGVATLEADWTLVPRDPARPTRRQRARIRRQRARGNRSRRRQFDAGGANSTRRRNRYRPPSFVELLPTAAAAVGSASTRSPVLEVVRETVICAAARTLPGDREPECP